MKFSFKINTILPGWSPSEYFCQSGQFQNSLAIDPEMPRTDSLTQPSGLLRPTSMAKFSGTEVTGVPMWMITNNKNTNTYVYTDDGKVHVFDADIAMGTALNSGNALTTAAGNGAEYYNNYLYFASNTDITRYGPLNGSPSLAQTYWTSGLSLTALANTTYPSINGIKIPNHPMYVHPANNRLYFGDVTSNNIGCISFIKTKKGTAEGDTNDTTVPSAYNALDFYYNWWPTAISSVGNELAIALIDGSQTTTSKVKQGCSYVAFWDTLPSTTSYNRIAPIPDPLITAMLNVNGQLYVFSGSASGGMRISRYLGGESFEELFYADDQLPPFQGAVDCQINRIVWGNRVTTPTAAGCVFAMGSKSRAMSMGLHNILKNSGSGTAPLVTAVKYIEQGASKQPIIGWTDGTAKGLDKLSTTYSISTFRSQIFNVAQSGQVNEIRIPLAQAVATNQTITVKVYSDDGSSNTTIATINSTNNSASERFIKTAIPAHFKNNFFIELAWSGTALATVGLPIIINGETYND